MPLVHCFILKMEQPLEVEVYYDLITLHACARGKVIGRVIVIIVVVMDTKITKSGDLGI